MRALLSSAGPVASMVSIQCVSQTPQEPLDGYALVLVDGADGLDARLEPSSQGRLGGVLVLVEGPAAPPPAMAMRLARVRVPVVFWGTVEEDEGAREIIAGHLFGAPALTHLDPVLERMCTAEQAQVIRTFLTRAGASTPRRVAGSVARSRRSLARDCQELGLACPRVLLRAARVTRGLAWVRSYGGGAKQAALAAGYNDSESWRRAVWKAFGLGPDEILDQWQKEEAIGERYRAVMLRG